MEEERDEKRLQYDQNNCLVASALEKMIVQCKCDVVTFVTTLVEAKINQGQGIFLEVDKLREPLHVIREMVWLLDIKYLLSKDK